MDAVRVSFIIIVLLVAIATAGCTGQPGRGESEQATLTPSLSPTHSPVTMTTPLVSPTVTSTLVSPATTVALQVTGTTPSAGYPPGGIGPGPIDPLPSNIDPAIRVEKDRVYSDLIITYTGGIGQALLRKVTVKATLTDGQVIEKEIPFSTPGTISRGDSVTITGTRGPDRVEVTFHTADNSYTVYNDTLANSGYYT